MSGSGQLTSRLRNEQNVVRLPGLVGLRLDHLTSHNPSNRALSSHTGTLHRVRSTLHNARSNSAHWNTQDKGR